MRPYWGSNLEEIRLWKETGNSWLATLELANTFGKNRIMYSHYYNPRYKPKLIVFKFPSKNQKEKCLNHSNFNNWISSVGVTTYVPTIPDTPDRDKRTIFCRNLFRSYFTTWSNHDDEEKVEHLQKNKEEFKNFIHDALGEQIEQVHLITRNAKDVPRAMTIRFKTEEQAANFVATDTFIGIGWLQSVNKKFNESIRIKQCKVCREVGHLQGDSKCKGGPRCPRCAATDHTNIASPNCTNMPYCLTCKVLGHSTASDKCPTNVAYKHKKRQEMNEKRKIEERTRDTPEDQRKFHEDLLRSEKKAQMVNKISRAQPLSFAAAAGGGSARNTNLTNIPQVAPTKTFDPLLLQMAYVECAMHLPYDPDSFQSNMNKLCEWNKWPKMFHLPPHPEQVKALEKSSKSMVTQLNELSEVMAAPKNAPAVVPSARDLSPPSGSQIRRLINSEPAEEMEFTIPKRVREGSDNENESSAKKRNQDRDTPREVEGALGLDLSKGTKPVVAAPKEKGEAPTVSLGVFRNKLRQNKNRYQDQEGWSVIERAPRSPPGEIIRGKTTVDHHTELHALSQEETGDKGEGKNENGDISFFSQEEIKATQIKATQLRLELETEATIIQAEKIRSELNKATARGSLTNLSVASSTTSSTSKEQRKPRSRNTSKTRREKEKLEEEKLKEQVLGVGKPKAFKKPLAEIIDPIQTVNKTAMNNFMQVIVGDRQKSREYLMKSSEHPVPVLLDTQASVKYWAKTAEDLEGVHTIKAGSMLEVHTSEYFKIIKRKDIVVQYPSLCFTTLEAILKKHKDLRDVTVYFTKHLPSSL